MTRWTIKGWAFLALGAALLGCGVQATEHSRFPAAEPRMPMVTYYDPAQEGPLGPPVHESAIAEDPQNGGGESSV